MSTVTRFSITLAAVVAGVVLVVWSAGGSDAPGWRHGLAALAGLGAGFVAGSVALLALAAIGVFDAALPDEHGGSVLIIPLVGGTPGAVAGALCGATAHVGVAGWQMWATAALAIVAFQALMDRRRMAGTRGARSRATMALVTIAGVAAGTVVGGLIL